MKAMMFVLIIFSSALFADNDQTEGRYQLGFKVDDIKVAAHDENSLSEYTDTGDFLKMFGTMVNHSKTYQMFLKYLTTAPGAYQASMDTVQLNEFKKLNTQIDKLIENQKQTNAFLKKISGSLSTKS